MPHPEGGNEPVQILRPFRWLATALQTFRQRPLPGVYAPIVTPTIDTFGTEAYGAQVQFASDQSPLGGIELLHSRIALDRIRFYISMEWFHDDVAGTIRQLAPIRVGEFAGGFPQQLIGPTVGLDGDGGGEDQQREARQSVIGLPGGFVGVRAGAMGVGARLTLRVTFIEFPVGEYVFGMANL